MTTPPRWGEKDMVSYCYYLFDMQNLFYVILNNMLHSALYTKYLFSLNCLRCTSPAAQPSFSPGFCKDLLEAS